MIARKDALEALAGQSFDVLVIGGGITGAGVALDAASRGYSVALAERDDFACGTSSRSSKMVHGGLRYLQNFDVGLVREALLERQLMVELAPHLVWPRAFIVPSFKGNRPDIRVGIGLNIYDAMATTRFGRRGERDGAASWSPERHRIIDGDEVADLLPALAGRSPTAGYLFYDCQTDDSRLVLSVLGEAERYGAIVANRVEVVDLIAEKGQASGAECLDVETDSRLPVRAKHIVNATGVWADRIRPGELESEGDVPRMSPSRGTHIAVPQDKLPLKAAAIVPAGSGRMIFALPWLGCTLVGTTDNDYEGSLEHPQPPADDISYLLEALNRFFGCELGLDDVASAFAGVRPLISTGDPKKSVDISRRAELYETSSGLITITGGKLTTWRRMAKMTVDRIAEREWGSAECRTHEIQIGQPVDADDLADVGGVDDAQKEALAARYGHAAHDVLAMAAKLPDLAVPVLPGHPDLLVEAAFAARNEQAQHVGDVLLRRTRLALIDARPLAGKGSDAARRVAQAMAPELGWDETRVEHELERWHELARSEGVAVAPAPVGT